MNLLFEDIIGQLKIIDVKELHTHEETIPANLMRLKEAMLNIGQLVDPLIVDKKSKTILDGNHRIKVLEMIKCPRAVCQVVDYSSPEIKVGTWFPVAESIGFEALKGAGLKLEETDLKTGLDALSKKQAIFMVSKKEKGVKKNYLVNPAEYTLDEMMEEQKKALEMIEGTEFFYLPDDSADQLVESGKTVFYRKIYSKEEIVARALAGKRFVPKSTRHVIPDRIIRLNMRLGWLHEGEAEAKSYLERILRERVYNGNVRRYSEPVIVIY